VGGRIAVESKSNRSCNHFISRAVGVVLCLTNDKSCYLDDLLVFGPVNYRQQRLHYLPVLISYPVLKFATPYICNIVHLTRPLLVYDPRIEGLSNSAFDVLQLNLAMQCNAMIVF